MQFDIDKYRNFYVGSYWNPQACSGIAIKIELACSLFLSNTTNEAKMMCLTIS